MIVYPPCTENARGSERSNDRSQDYRFPIVILSGIAHLSLCPVIHLLATLCHEPVNQHDDDRRRYDHVGADTSFNTETRVIENSIARRGGFELEDGILRHNAAVGQAEHDALGEIPGCVRPDHGPKAVPVINDQREQNADQEDLQKAEFRHAGISHVQGHKDQGVHKDCDGRPAISPAQLLIEITSVHDLFRARLDHHAQQKYKEDLRVKSAVGQLDIPHDDRHQDAESVHAKSEQDTGRDRFEVVAVSVIKESFPHGPVALKEQGHQNECDPYSIKVKILKKERHAVRIP